MNVRGVVVGRRPAGEGSARVLVYTDGLGLIEALAKSVREERSKLRSHLALGTRGVFTVVRGAGPWRVTGAVLTENAYFALAGSVSSKEAVARVIGVVRQFIRGEGSDPYLFDALWKFLAVAPSFSDEDMRAAEALAVLKIMAALGYVSADGALAKFLDAPYERASLAKARAARPLIVGAINEGMAVSHL